MSTSDHVSEKNAFGQENHFEKGTGAQESNHVSIGDVISGTAVQELTPFERKAALINALVLSTPVLQIRGDTDRTSEIDKFGFGKYQKCIWLLCGFGYFVDLAWAQGVGLLATAIL